MSDAMKGRRITVETDLDLWVGEVLYLIDRRGPGWANYERCQERDERLGWSS